MEDDGAGCAHRRWSTESKCGNEAQGQYLRFCAVTAPLDLYA